MHTLPIYFSIVSRNNKYLMRIGKFYLAFEKVTESNLCTYHITRAGGNGREVEYSVRIFTFTNLQHK